MIGILAIVGGLILLSLAFLNEILSRKAYSEISTGTVAATNYAEASLRNSEVIKAMGMLGNIREIWQTKHNQLLAAQTKSIGANPEIL